MNGKICFPGGEPDGSRLSAENFRKKVNTFRGIPLFLFSPELLENHCTIYFIRLVPCSWIKIRDLARENGVLLHVSHFEQAKGFFMTEIKEAILPFGHLMYWFL